MRGIGWKLLVGDQAEARAEFTAIDLPEDAFRGNISGDLNF